jgi:hypothetical protein
MLLFIKIKKLKEMAICNLFNEFTNYSGNFLMFSQYVEDITQNFTKNDSNYRVVPSKFIALNIDYLNLDKSVFGLGPDPAITSELLNVGIPKYFQNYYENGCAFGRTNVDWDPNKAKNLFWNAMWDGKFLTSYKLDSENSEEIINEVMYYGDINMHSYNEHKGMGYGEIYCYIPTDSGRVHCQVVKHENRESVKNPNDRIEGFDEITNLSKNYYYNTDFLMSFYEDKLADINIPSSYKYDINTIVILYDVFEKLNDEWINMYSGIPLGMYITGKFVDNKLTNVITKYVTTSYGTGTSYGLRICTRFSVTPNGIILNTNDVTVDENYTNFCQLMVGMNENLSKMMDVVKSTNDTTQQYKDLLSIVKNNRTNVPYVKNVNGDDCWFVNGRFVAKVEGDQSGCMLLTPQDIDNHINGLEVDGCFCDEVSAEELAEALGVNIEEEVPPTPPTCDCEDYDIAEDNDVDEYLKNTVVSRLKISPTLKTLYIGEKYKLHATFNSDNVSENCIWKSDDDCISVDASGNIVANKIGSAIVTAEYESDACCIDKTKYLGKCKVFVVNKREVNNIRIAADKNNIDAKETIDARAEFYTSLNGVIVNDIMNVTDKCVWESSNTDVATVLNGKITGVSAGKALIYAKYDNELASFMITVNPEDSISLSKDTLNFDSNSNSDYVIVEATDSFTFTENSDWVSFNVIGNVVNVSVNENIGENDRSTTVLFSCGDATAKLFINQDGNTPIYIPEEIKSLTSISLNKTSISGLENSSDYITVTAHYSDGTSSDVTSKTTGYSNNMTVATYNAGTISLKKSGSATIVVSYAEDSVVKESSILVNVTKQDVIEYEFKLNKTNVSLKEGGTVKLVAKYYTITNGISDNGENVTNICEWTSDDNSIATVSSGTITGMGNGTTNITAKYKGYTSKCNVTIDKNNISVNPDDLLFTAYGGTERLNVTSDGDWTVETDATWLWTNNTSGSKNGSVILNVSENTSSESNRYANVTFKCGGAKAVVTVSQSKKDSLTITPPNWNASSASESKTFTVSANGPWTATCNEQWLSITSKLDNSITLLVHENTDITNSRSATVTITCGSATSSITVVQAKKTSIAVDPDSCIFEVNGGENFITVTANGPWTATSDADWLTVTKKSSTIASLKATNNTNTDPRSTIVTFTCTGDGGTDTKTVNVSQIGKDPDSIVVTPSSYTFAYNDTAKNITVTANGDWTATSNKDWITVEKKSLTSANIYVTENTDIANDRTGKVTFTCGTSSSDFNVIQTKKDSITIDGKSDVSWSDIVYSGTTKTFEVAANGNWTAVSSDTNWLNVSDTEGTGDKTISLTVANNEEIKSRTGSVTFNRGNSTAVINVTQNAMVYTLSVDPSSWNLESTSSSIDIDVTSNGPWAASTTANWITIGSKSGNGNATVKLTANEYTGTSKDRLAKVVFKSTKDINVTGDVSITQSKRDLITIDDLTYYNWSDVSSSGTTKTFKVTANGPWTAVCDDEWVKLSSSVGTANSDITIEVLENTSGSNRSETVTFKCGAATATIEITQLKNRFIEITPKTLSFAASGEETKYITISSNSDWKLSQKGPYTTVDPDSGKTGMHRVSVKMQKNDEKGRTDTLVFVHTDDATISAPVKLTQAGADYINFDNQWDVSSQASTKKITISSNGPWIAESDSNWLYLNPAKGDNGDDVTISVNANTSTETRTGYITFTRGDATGKLKVIQTGREEDQISISTNALNVGSYAGTEYITVTANGKWTALSNLPGIAASPAGGESGEHEITISHVSNTGAARIAIITFTCGTKSVELTVNQAGFTEDSMTFNPQYLTAKPASKGDYEVKITSSGNWTIESKPDWISAYPGGVNGATLKITFAENNSASGRDGTIEFKCGNTKFPYSVSQLGLKYINFGGEASSTAGTYGMNFQGEINVAFSNSIPTDTTTVYKSIIDRQSIKQTVIKLPVNADVTSNNFSNMWVQINGSIDSPPSGFDVHLFRSKGPSFADIIKSKEATPFYTLDTATNNTIMTGWFKLSDYISFTEFNNNASAIYAYMSN